MPGIWAAAPAKDGCSIIYYASDTYQCRQLDNLLRTCQLCRLLLCQLDNLLRKCQFVFFTFSSFRAPTPPGKALFSRETKESAGALLIKKFLLFKNGYRTDFRNDKREGGAVFQCLGAGFRRCCYCRNASVFIASNRFQVVNGVFFCLELDIQLLSYQIILPFWWLAPRCADPVHVPSTSE